MGKKILRIFFNVAILLCFLAFIALVYPLVSRGESSVDYKTKDFQEGNEVAMLYICAITGHKTGKANDALVLLGKFVNYAEISASHSSDLLSDANKWWDYESSVFDLNGMWEGMCEQSLNNIRRTLE